VLGVLTSITGPLLFAPDSGEAAFLLVLATSAGYLFLGGRIADRAVTGIGAVGAVVGLAGFLVAIGVDDEASGGAVLALGAGLFVAAVLVARQLGAPRPTLGAPELPIGPKVVAVVDAPAAPPTVPPPPEVAPPPPEAGPPPTGPEPPAP
jgi:drug/metabolite transporter (DMT)-like permease